MSIIDSLEQAHAKTTTGEWKLSMDADDNHVVYVDAGPDCACVVVQTDWGEEEDAEAIAIWHNHAPRIIAVLKAARSCVNELKIKDSLMQAVRGLESANARHDA